MAQPEELTDEQITAILLAPYTLRLKDIAKRFGCSINQAANIRCGHHRRGLRIGTRLGVFPRTKYCTVYIGNGVTRVRHIDEVAALAARYPL
jgi:hypothetical protein